jgi:molecular chaperone DnaK (HSP70)
MSKNAKNTIFDAKRMIGSRFSSENVQADLKTWPFEVKADSSDRPQIKVQEGGLDKVYYPEQISAMVL